jgi:hypothetical protein
MRREVAGENPSALELLLAERVVALWLLIKFIDGAVSGALYACSKEGSSQEGDGHSHRLTVFTPSFLALALKWQENAHRRYLSAIRECARVRKLQSNVPGIQYNTQINVAGGQGQTPRS